MHMIVLYPERSEIAEGVESAPEYHTLGGDLYVYTPGFLVGKEAYSDSGDDDKDTKDKVIEIKRQHSGGYSYDAKPPIPIHSLPIEVMFGALPFEQSFH